MLLLIAFESSSIVLFVAVLQILKVVYAKGNPLVAFIYSTCFLAQFINSHADPITAIKTVIVVFFRKIPSNLTKCNIFRQIMVLFRLATLWPVINTAQRHSSLQLRSVKNYKETADGTQHFLLIWKYLSAEQGKDKRVTRHVQLLKWHQQWISWTCINTGQRFQNKWQGQCELMRYSNKFSLFQEGILIPDVVWNRTLENTW